MTEEEVANTDSQDSGQSFGGFVLEMVKLLLISLLIVVPIRAYVVQPFYVDGASMEPNFHDGEYLIVDEISYRFTEPVRGEIVIFHPPTNNRVFYIKRLIGLPGERVVIDDGEIKVYQEGESEPFFVDETEYLSADYQLRESESHDVTLAESEYFLMGDNRRSSLDSRRLGPIPEKAIKGKVLLRAFPFDKFEIINSPTYK
ncbi:MAG: signal peptidase I [Candidatus Komeilibacteria bacterium]|nr:signal peptidase I [Candidatus Komeilibacteria bacterium]